MNTGASSYTFQAAPKALVGQRNLFRQPAPSPTRKNNIMHDRRVVRGNTYRAQVETSADPLLAATGPLSATRPKRPPASTAQFAASRSDGSRVRTPEPVAGRKHMEIQTDNYLEELTDKPHEEHASTQTDMVLDRPSAVLFVPLPSGESKETQIYEGELFDFGAEVEPILEVLIGKAVDQALMEVLEEQEFKAIKAQQEAFEQRRAVELAEAQRLEAAEKRRLEEAYKRKQQEEVRIKREKLLTEKLAARAAAKDYLGDLQQKVVERLQKTGVFQDPLQLEIQNQFLPWLTEQATIQLNYVEVGHSMVDALLESAMDTQAQERKAAMDVLEAIQLKNAAQAQKEAELAAANLVIAHVPVAQVVVEGDEGVAAVSADVDPVVDE